MVAEPENLAEIYGKVGEDSSKDFRIRNRAAATGSSILAAAGALGALGGVAADPYLQAVAIGGGMLAGGAGLTSLGASLAAHTQGASGLKTSLSLSAPEMRRAPVRSVQNYVDARRGVDETRSHRRAAGVFSVGGALIATGLALAAFSGALGALATSLSAFSAVAWAGYSAYTAVMSVSYGRRIREGRRSVDHAREEVQKFDGSRRSAGESQGNSADRSAPREEADRREGRAAGAEPSQVIGGTGRLPNAAEGRAHGAEPGPGNRGLGPGLHGVVPKYDGKDGRPRILPPGGAPGQSNRRGA